MWPTLEASLQAQRQRTAFRAPIFEGEQVFAETVYTGSLGAAYEVDLWGRLRGEARAAALASRASREDVQALAMTTAARVTGAWLDLAHSRRQAALLEEQIAIAREYLDLARLQFGQGQGSALDVTQQEQQIESVQAVLIQERANLQLARHELAVLLGEAPQEFGYTPPRELPALPPLPNPGFPAALLQRRPDLRAVMHRLRAADAQVSAALASRLPQLRLDGAIFTQATSPGRLFETLLWNAAAGLSDTVFSGGREAAAIDTVEARARQALFAYAATFATALQEVANALDTELAQQRLLGSVRRQLEAARSARELARDRYRLGAVDYQRVLDALDAVHRLEREELRVQRQPLGTRVQLHRALGGSFAGATTPPPEIPAAAGRPR